MAFTEVIKFDFGFERTIQCLHFETLTVSSTAVALPNVPANVQYCVFSVEAQPIRMRLDGVNPTATVGQLFLATEIVLLKGRQLIQKAKYIRQGGTDGVLMIHYFG